MYFASHRKQTRIILMSLVMMVLVAAVVWAATEVTVTKTSSKYATTYYYDGSTYVGATLREMNDAYLLSYYIYDYDGGFQIIEQGYGEIDSGDVSWTSNGVSLDTNTEDIATVGDGGDLVLEWDVAPDNYYETTSKVTTKYMGTTTKTFGDRESSTAIVEGTFFDEDYAGTGSIQVQTGKVIVQVK